MKKIETENFKKTAQAIESQFGSGIQPIQPLKEPPDPGTSTEDASSYNTGLNHARETGNLKGTIIPVVSKLNYEADRVGRIAKDLLKDYTELTEAENPEGLKSILEYHANELANLATSIKKAIHTLSSSVE